MGPGETPGAHRRHHKESMDSLLLLVLATFGPPFLATRSQSPT